jgi:paraquat-inducible protein A
MKPWEGSAAAAGLASCHHCDRVSEVSQGRCPRCGAVLHTRKQFGLQRTIALLTASVIAYIPANTMPIMRVDGVGGGESSTILSGVVTFWSMHAYPIAITIFVASIIIPVLKLIALGWLCAAAIRRGPMNPRRLTRVYWLTEVVGRWSMVDVFVVAVMVALVQLGNLMSIHPGPAALSFGAVVVLTMLAALSFDPRILWDRANASERGPIPSKLQPQANHVATPIQ